MVGHGPQCETETKLWNERPKRDNGGENAEQNRACCAVIDSYVKHIGKLMQSKLGRSKKAGFKSPITLFALFVVDFLPYL